MSKRMLIDATHAEETRVVVADGTRIEDFDFESLSKKQLRGNIYLAKVTRVEPSLQAAFIEYGGNRHGFLAFNEIHPDYYQIPLADREALLREEAEEADEAPSRATSSGDDEDADVEDDDDVVGEEVARRNRRLMRRYKIQEVIRRRQIMLVQVVKEERGNKGAALTTYLSLAGRYGVLMPNTPRGGGISRKITTATDRKRLKGVVQSLEVPQGMGLIVRTAGAKRTKAELKRDYEYLMRLWEDIREKTLKSIAPSLIYEEEDLVKRAIRDMYDKDLEGIWVEGEPGFREAREFMRMLMPSQAKKVQLYKEATPLYVATKVEDQLAQIYNPVVPLRSGGYLVINQTEALVAIDVNSGRSTRERNIEATALKTNLEAAEEAARQLRLRDLAGLIVIDFIDMDEGKNNRAVEKRLKDSLSEDRARVQMGKISTFGLMEISRQRRRTGVLEGTTHVCEHCQGTGRLRSTESSALAALRAVEMDAVRNGAGAVTLKAPSAVALYILNSKRDYLALIEERHDLTVSVTVDEALAHAEHALERTESLGAEARPAGPVRPVLTPPPASEPDLDDVDEADEEGENEAAEAQDDDADGGRRGGRRRRRRRGGRREDGGGEREARADEAAEETVDAENEDDGSEDGTDAQGRRRRRRGRRGGRRGREEGRRDDVYAWSRPRVPDGDPYVWMDVADITGQPRGLSAPQAPPASPPEPVPVAADVIAAPVTEAAAPREQVPDDVWVELPPRDEAPAAKSGARARPSRRRKSKADAEEAATADVAVIAEAPPAQADVPPEPAAEAAPEPPAPAPVAAEPALPAPKEPATPAEPLAGEIAAPPANPRKGWWRRNA